MGVAQDFAEYATDLIFKKSTVIEEDNGAEVTSYTPAFEAKKGIFQQTAGDRTYGPNGVEVRTTNDIYVDKDEDTDGMYEAIRKRKETWRVEYDGIEYEIMSIEAPGEASDPYILKVAQVI